MNGQGNYKPDDGTHARFPSKTQWTMLIQPAGDSSSPEAREALNRLCQIYWFPLYAFIRSQRIDSHRAKDLTQAFFLHLIEGNLIKEANREKGRFRTFLLSCVRNFLKDEWRKDNALKRGGKVPVVSIDEMEAEEKYQRLPAVQSEPEVAFDRTWAATVIKQATIKLKQTYAERGRLDVYEAVKGCLNGDLSPSSHPEVSARLGMTKETFEVNLTRFRQAFGQAVREVITQIVDPSEVNEEIKYLLAAWSAYLNQK